MQWQFYSNWILLKSDRVSADNVIMVYRFYAEIIDSLDINECELDIDECNINANCSNNMGSYDCMCISGYEGSGFNEDCSSKCS